MLHRCKLLITVYIFVETEETWDVWIFFFTLMLKVIMLHSEKKMSIYLRTLFFFWNVNPCLIFMIKRLNFLSRKGNSEEWRYIKKKLIEVSFKTWKVFYTV